jgi:hypothetical protein
VTQVLKRVGVVVVVLLACLGVALGIYNLTGTAGTGTVQYLGSFPAQVTALQRDARAGCVVRLSDDAQFCDGFVANGAMRAGEKVTAVLLTVPAVGGGGEGELVLLP